VLAHNATLLASFVLCGLAAFALARERTGSGAGALVAGAVFAFAPLRLAHVVHVQLLTSFWMPVCLLFLFRVVEKRRWRDAAGFGVSLAGQALASFYNGLFLAVAAALAVAHAAAGRRLDRGAAVRLAGGGALAAVFVLPATLPYFEARRLYRFERAEGETRGFSARLSDYARPPADSLAWGRLLPAEGAPTGERAVFPGLVPVALAAVALARWRALRRDRLRGPEAAFYPLLAAAGVVLSLGPWASLAGRSLPLPYLLLYEAVPGFKGLRAPARFSVLVALGLALLAALGAASLVAAARRRGAGRAAAATAALLAAVAVDAAISDVPATPVPVGAAVPPVYRWLAGQPPATPLVELPLRPDTDNPSLYFSTYHWQPVLNGSSGFQPPGNRRLRLAARRLPDPEAATELREVGLRLVVLHLDGWPGAGREAVQARFDASPELQLVATFGSDLVYGLVER
jgi:hypothetical protein